MSVHTAKLPWSIFHWWRMRRESRRRALVAETAALVIQQHGQAWTKKRCPICGTPAASPEARYCAQCGMSLVTPTELHPFAVESAAMPFDDNERHTSAMRPVVIPARPMQGARQRHNTKVLNAETLPLEVPEHIQQIIRKRRHIEAIVARIRKGR